MPSLRGWEKTVGTHLHAHIIHWRHFKYTDYSRAVILVPKEYSVVIPGVAAVMIPFLKNININKLNYR